MPSCRVNECSNRSGGGVRLFSIPKRSRDIEIAKKWLKSVWERELDEEQFALLMKEEFRVCAEHFVESDFDARGKLKADAVPSRFPWNGGQQRTASINKSRSIPSEHKSNGVLANKLSKALRVAETVVDGEIKDIDRWITQLEAQIEHLRYKRDKLVSHKAELNKSFGGSLPVKLENSPREQLGLNSNFALNGAHSYNFTNSTPGESLFLSSSNLAEEKPVTGEVVMPDQGEVYQQRLNSKPVRRTADHFLNPDRYSFDCAGLLTPNLLDDSEHANESHDCLPPQDYSAVTISSAHDKSHRQFATRRKKLKPTRRIDINRAASDNSSDEKINPLPSSSTFTSRALTATCSSVVNDDDSNLEPIALSLNNGKIECGEEPPSGRQCDSPPVYQA